MKKGMIKLSVFYPNGGDITFNMDYYFDRHIPLVRSLLGEACKGVEVEKGLAGLGEPDTPAPYLVCGHLFFDSMGDLHKALNVNLDQMAGDIPNFTNAQADRLAFRFSRYPLLH
ncbi:EthD family reductase [Cyclobacterium sp. SYSU L10401]|uniref:EthD family reductase n=1 Tax=Cyclobacterium sp. SYSU L10401 TaxID=2678657 RepID=UPI001969FF0A|nr:EthD family reductase [Cyclobacterium sp. SYSU L10401]